MREAWSSAGIALADDKSLPMMVFLPLALGQKTGRLILEMVLPLPLPETVLPVLEMVLPLLLPLALGCLLYTSPSPRD